MKSMLIASMFVICLMLLICFVSTSFGHGGPDVKELQMFPDSIAAQPIANISGVGVAIPCTLIGGFMGLIAAPFTRDIKETLIIGIMFGGMSGYMAGQQIGWPIYGIEKGIRWCLE